MKKSYHCTISERDDFFGAYWYSVHPNSRRLGRTNAQIIEEIETKILHVKQLTYSWKS